MSAAVALNVAASLAAGHVLYRIDDVSYRCERCCQRAVMSLYPLRGDCSPTARTFAWAGRALDQAIGRFWAACQPDEIEAYSTAISRLVPVVEAHGGLSMYQEDELSGIQFYLSIY